VPICARDDPTCDCVGRMRMLLIRAYVLLGMRVVRVQRVRWSRKVYAAMGIDVTRVIQGVSYYNLVSGCFQAVGFTTGEISTIFCYNCFPSGSVRDTHDQLEICIKFILFRYYEVVENLI